MKNAWKSLKEGARGMKKNDVVQFTENHKWCGCLGIVSEVKPSKIMVGVPMPSNDGNTGTAYIFCQPEDVELIGEAVLGYEE